jgi:hypothetical protein
MPGHKKSKMMAGGGAMKKSKGMAKGGAMKKSKYMARGGAMKMAKGMARGGAMKGVKGRAKGGRVGGMGNIPKSVLKALALGAGAGLASKATMPRLVGRVAKKPQKVQAVQQARLQAKKSPNETVVVARRRKGTLAPGKPGSRKR